MRLGADVKLDRARLAEDLLSFAQLGPGCVSAQALLDEFLARVRPHGVETVVAGVMTDAGRNFKFGPRYGSINETWLAAYMNQQLYKDDPAIGFALRGVRGGYWSQTFQAEKLTKGQQKVLAVAAEHGLGDGFITPVPLLNGDIVIVALQGRELDHHPDVEAVLRGLSAYYGTEGHRLAVQSQLRSTAFSSLTLRQVQILHLSALGRRNSYIAEELGISEATVNFHLARARERLGARTTKEALRLIHATPQEFFTP